MRIIRQWYRKAFVLPSLLDEANRQLADLTSASLREVRVDLEAVAAQIARGDSLIALVQFFRVVSILQDNGMVWRVFKAHRDSRDKVPTWVESQLEILCTHIARAGRVEYGMNRTKQGELVTSENVWIGGICGLNTLSVAYWSKCKDDPKGGWAGTIWENYCRDMNAYDAISRHAQHFLQSHVTGMLDLIDQLTKYVRINQLVA